ncbi:MAG: site-specific integrase [Holophagales bacterium]|jgi:integrase|nr:site-specific integrase [Holophagales bacterium]
MTSHRLKSLPVTLFQIGARWYCRFQIDGRQTVKTTRELKLFRAKAVASEYYTAALLRSRGEEPCPTLAAAFGMWEQAHLLRKSPAHITSVNNIASLHLGSLKNILLKDLTTKLVEDELNTFLQAHSHSSANLWLTCVKLVCRWAIKRGMLKNINFSVPKIKIKQRPKKLIPTHKTGAWMDEVRFLTQKAPEIAMILRLMIGLGLRGVEARGARWEWLDLERGLYTPGGTKGGAAWPRPVPTWILDELRPVAKSHGWIAPSRAGRPVTYARVKRVFDAACRSVGIPKLTPHRLRATYATWLAEEGVPIQKIKAVLEHKDIKTTELYLGVDLEGVTAAQVRIARRTGLK